MDETDEERGTWLSVFQWIVEKKKTKKNNSFSSMSELLALRERMGSAE